MKKGYICSRVFKLRFKNVEIISNYVKDYEKLLGGGIWCIVKLQYFYEDGVIDQNLFIIDSITPIKISKEEWIDILIRNIGM